MLSKLKAELSNYKVIHRRF